MRVPFELGEECDLQQAARELVSLQYDRNDDVLTRGCFRIKGDILEVFPAYMQEAFRVEVAWDEVERIRKFHPLTGEILEELDFCIIYPAKHFIMPEYQIQNAIEDIKTELNERYEELVAQNKLVEAQRLKTRTLYDLEMLDEMGYCPGIENYSRHLSGRKPGERPAVLIDYFPEQFLTFIDESHVTLSQVGGMYEGDRARKQSLVDHGFRLPSALDNRPLVFSEFESLLDQTIFVSATPREEEVRRSAQMVEQIIRPTGLLDPHLDVRKTEGQIEDLYAEIRNRIEHKERTLVTTLTKKMAEDLSDYLSDMGLKVRYLHSDIETIERVEILRDLRRGEFDVLVGINLLREGLDLPEVALIAILDADKIGFLRSSISLIQIIGRAARNVNGTVIMYADRVSDAMREAIDETQRRRRIQEEYNREHNITPKTIDKSIQDIIVRKKEEKRKSEQLSIDVLKNSYNLLNPKQRNELVKILEKEMFEHAKNLEFEEAAVIRDEIDKIKKMTA
jgi:excinuclease ABC subunit B